MGPQCQGAVELKRQASVLSTACQELAEAIWAAIADRRIAYVLPPASFERAGQKVRGPSDVLERKVGTCLDLSLLYAACLEQAGLNPVLVLTVGHAFVGVFLARISRGRTIRQFILVVLGMPSLAFFAWFSVFGGSAIDLDLNGGTDIAGATAADLNSAFFVTLAEFPLPMVTATLVVILAVLFFVSGADANTYVLGMLTTHGSIQPRTPILLLWGAVTGALAIILLISGGLNALQQTVIVASAPFLVVIVGVVVSFLRDLRTEPAAAPCQHHDHGAAQEDAPVRKG